ncbi:flagellar assembly protein FliH [Microbacterium oxydans]|uniref:FliH/SctL family protein n=1 Tax=Microbacterium sp. B19(2022) TaxID=2914045 RepID=UPI00142FC031|nr:FliH/SctL family protein [Microbacterium sp. B19(2022)]NJI60589.1 flagellar assembly protein FliH [Microbacterium sp. B19(2022)]
MSTDAFSPVLFPRLDGRADGAEHARARMRGYAEGHAEGFRAGLAGAESAQRVAAAEQAARDATAAREMETAVSALQAAARSLSERERELTGAAGDEVLRCAIELAELILAAELSDAGSSAAAAARRALAVTDPADIREVRLHPDDLQTLQTAESDLAAFALVADDTLERGDAVATLAHGHIDARIGSALERARRALVEAGS